ncbi:MAG: hypothetical protein ACHQ4H_02140, partial [Ktedonobacterales bacterium]
MRPQQDLGNAQSPDFLGASGGAGAKPAPSQSRERLPTPAASLADLAAWERLLVAHIPAERALVAALEHAAALLPSAR